MSENKRGSLRSFRKDYPEILTNESKHWKALKNLSSSMSLFLILIPPPPNKINRYFFLKAKQNTYSLGPSSDQLSPLN